MNLKQYLPENWVKMNLNQIEIKSTLLPWNSSKWAKISTKIDEKWDKNKNNGFGLGPQFLIIKFNKSQPKSMKIEWKWPQILGQIQIKL